MAAPSSPPPPPAASGVLAAKAEEVRRVLSEPSVDLWKLRELALTEGGLVNDSLRKLAWPKLVGVRHSRGQCDRSTPAPPTAAAAAVVPPSLDREQIERDVSRVTWHLLTGNRRSRYFQMKNKHRKRVAQLLRKKQRRLGDFLNLTLVRSYEGADRDVGDHDGGDGDESVVRIRSGEGGSDERLRYYQGFHDVGSVVLSALGGADAVATDEDPASSTSPSSRAAADAASSMGLGLACQVLLRLSRSHLRDAMRPDFRQLQSALKLVVLPLTAAFDPELHAHLRDCEMEPYFCLSWIITWFSHDVRDTALVKRLYDFFLASHPLMSSYLAVAMMIHPLNRIEVLSADCDFACVHHALADLPRNSSDAGWKYQPGDRGSSSGYVTGEDDDAASYDSSLRDQSLDEGEDASVVSCLSGRSRPRARVPFQELIDLSISLMHKIPPRNLINLAQRYHNEIALQPLMAQSSSIALLQPPPSWGLASCADSDWVVRQKRLEERGLAKGLNRHQRKNRLKQQNGGSECGGTHSSPGKPSITVLIASGTGPDGLAEERKARRKRRMIARSVAVVVISVLVVLVKDYFSRQPIHSLESKQQRMGNQSTDVKEAQLPSSDHSRISVANEACDNDQPLAMNTEVKMGFADPGTEEEKEPLNNERMVKEDRREEGPVKNDITQETKSVKAQVVETNEWIVTEAKREKEPVKDDLVEETRREHKPVKDQAVEATRSPAPSVASKGKIADACAGDEVSCFFLHQA